MHANNLQGVIFVLYGVFMNVGKLNKAVSMLLLALLNRIVAKLRKFAVFKALTRRVESAMNALSMVSHACVERNDGNEPLKLKDSSMMDNPLRIAMYVSIFLNWAVATCVMMTFVTQISATEGSKAIQIILTTWGLTLLMEQFGIEGVKITVVKTLVDRILHNIDTCLASGAVLASVWYEDKMVSMVNQLNIDTAGADWDSASDDSDDVDGVHDPDDDFVDAMNII